PSGLGPDLPQKKLATIRCDVFALDVMPVAIVLSCGRGGNILAAEGILDVRAGIDGDWRAVECTRSNIKSDTRLLHAVLGDDKCKKLIRDVKPRVILCNVEKGADEAIVRNIMPTFIASSAD
ncbi:unnamed protein product, partial [Ectocarpus sp. 12 AP-2014]